MRVLLFALTLAVFNGCDTESAVPNVDPGSYRIENDVELRYAGRTGETIDAGDFFSDTALVWSADPAAGGGAAFGDVRITLPVTFEVTRSEDFVLNVEDVFGDNQFTWQHLERLTAESRRVGGEVVVDMPVVIRVADASRAVRVDVEDVFGDNAFTWTVGSASNPSAPSAVGRIEDGVGGAMRFEMSVTIEVLDSRDVEIDIEDVLNDSRFVWVGGDGSEAAFVGGPVRVAVPLTVRVERSEGVRINVEDTAGDLTFDWTAGAGDRVGGPVEFEVPSSFTVVDSRDVEVDFEDQGGDNLFTWTADGPSADAALPVGAVAATTPAEFRVTGSQGVRINSEDFFGDNVFVWAGPFPQDTRDALAGAVSARTSTTFEVGASTDVSIDAEDVYGDNLFAWEPLGLAQTSPLPPAVYDVVGQVRRDVEGDSVTVEFATLNEGNRYVWGPAPEIDR